MLAQKGIAIEAGGDLVECLLILCGIYGKSMSADSLIAGLPLEQHILSPDLFSRSAKRAGFTSKILLRDLSQLNQSLFPAILLLDKNSACLLLEIDHQQKTASVVFPDLNQASQIISIEVLQSRYVGRVIYVRPEQHFDARVASIAKITNGHWFWSVIAQHRKLYRDVLLAAFVINIFALASPLFVMNVYDRVVPNQATDTLWVLSVGVIIMMSADAALRIMRAWFVDLAASRTDITLSATIMERVLGMKLSARPESVGAFASSMQSFETVRSFISSATVLAFVDLPFVALFTLVVLIISWPLVFPVLGGIVIAILYAAIAQQKMHQLSEQSMQAAAQRNAILIESLQGLETLKAIGAEGRMQTLWERATLALSHTAVNMRSLSGTVGTGAFWIQQMVSVVVIIIGVYQIIYGNLTQGGLIAAYMLAARIMSPISQTAGLLMQYHSAATALSCLENTMQKPVERPLGAHWISRPKIAGAIEFKQVGFRYPQDNREVLRGVSFKINKGERVAILGRNGTGKTTIQKIIAGLYEPTEGSVLIDGIDMRQLDPAELRRNIGYVSQDVHLFFGSMRDNILMGSGQVSDAALLDAVRLSGLTDFVNQHPAGLSMPVGEGGQFLSGGQRQCVTIARAVLSDPDILLFDEPTGAMDHSSEEEFKRNMHTFCEGKTLLVITHRTSMLELVNRVIVIDAGKIVADGAKEKILEALRNGLIGRAQ